MYDDKQFNIITSEQKMLSDIRELLIDVKGLLGKVENKPIEAIQEVIDKSTPIINKPFQTSNKKGVKR